MFAKVDIFFLVVILFQIFSSRLQPEAFSESNQIRTISEGSDCRCKCILNVEDGAVCRNNPKNKRLIYSVDTISNGQNCKCSCLIPTPKDPCKLNESSKISVPIAEDTNGNVMSLEFSGEKFDFNETDQFSNLSNMFQKTLNLIKVIKMHAASYKLTKLLNQMEQIIDENSGHSQDAINDKFMKVIEGLRSEQVSQASTEDSIILDQENYKNHTGQFTATGAVSTTNNIDESFFSNSKTNQTAGITNTAVDLPQKNVAEVINGHANATNKNNAANQTYDVTQSHENIFNHGYVTKPRKNHPTVAISEASNSSSIETFPPAKENNNNSSGVNVLAGSYELYRKNDKPVLIKKEPHYDEYYDDEYYDYLEKDTSSIVHPSVETVSLNSSPDTSSQSKSSRPDETIDSKTTDVVSVSTTSTTQPNQDSSDDYSDYYDTNENSLFVIEAVSSSTPLPPTSTQAVTNLAPDSCGTLLNLSSPELIHDFGRREGAWMRDFAGKRENQNKIYVTNSYYGNRLIEFTSLKNFKDFRWSRSYLLPYNWMGTGHIVYNGSFYYSRAFSRNIIKYDLKYRYVTAWGSLRDAKYDVATTFKWRGHTMAHIVADESGLWVVYPTQSYFSNNNDKETYIINKINPIDLRVLNSWTLPMPRRHRISHMFIVCGVVYVTDRYDRKESRITYAHDTITRESRSLLLPFKNLFSYNVQLLYDPDQKKFFSWDDGHQIIYDINYTH